MTQATTIRDLTPAEAYGIASQWGSYIRSGDPGACFYGFPLNDGRPQDEDHRQACLGYGVDCLAYAQTLVDAAEDDEDARRDRDDLIRLCAFFVRSPLYSAPQSLAA